MAAIVGGLCMEGLWRGWRFAMIGMKKLQDISDEGYALSYNGNVHVLLTFKSFSWFVIPDAIQYNLIFNTLYKICTLISSPCS